MGTKDLSRLGNQLSYEHFNYVLKSQKAGIGLNQGIKAAKSHGIKRMFTNYQRRSSLLFVYMEKVAKDGRTCKPCLA